MSYEDGLTDAECAMGLVSEADVAAALERRPLRIRLMRGQVVVREETPPPSATLWTPELGPRQVKTHRGVVLGLGPPARLTEHPASPEVPHGFGVGDVVQYHFGVMGTQEARTRAWADGLPATWLVQAEVDAVWEASVYRRHDCVEPCGALGCVGFIVAMDALISEAP